MGRKPNSPAHPQLDGSTWIELGGDYFAVVDSVDYGLVADYRWCALKKGRKIYAIASRRDGTGRMHYMHSLILPNVALVDHKDGDGLNNRRGNLRPANKQQNAFNSVSKGWASKYHGVIRARSGKWMALMRVNRKRIYLGTYNTEEEAHAARLLGEKTYHPDFDRLVQ